MTTILEAVKRGYAYVVMNERGHFFSEGNYDILGAPVTDGDDAITWMSSQPWSNKKVGAIGCSSTAEWQPAVAALGNPNFTTMILQDSERASGASDLITSRATGIAAAPCRCFSSPGLTGNRIKFVRCFRRTLHRRFDSRFKIF
jgi:hypothetical protein